MATPEFEQTGRTSGQRITAEDATVPRGTGLNPQTLSNAADRFVDGFMERNPGLDPANQPALTSRFGDLSSGELVQALQQLRGTQHNMTPRQEDDLNALGIFT